MNAADPTKIGAWATMDSRQAGIWAAGGLASDGNGVFAITGNAPETANHDNSDSEEIIRITGLGVGNRDSKKHVLPDRVGNPMNSSDKDFGSASPTVVTVPDANPSKIIVAPAKPGRVYFLDGRKLGWLARSVRRHGGRRYERRRSIYTTPTAYTTSTGTHVAISTGVGSQCPGGKRPGQRRDVDFAQAERGRHGADAVQGLVRRDRRR